MGRKDSSQIEQKLDAVIGLLQRLLAVQLAREGLPKQAIARHLRIAKASVVAMLRGVGKKQRGE